MNPVDEFAYQIRNDFYITSRAEEVKIYHPNEPGKFSGILYLILGGLAVAFGQTTVFLTLSIMKMPAPPDRSIKTMNYATIGAGVLILIVGVLFLIFGCYNLILLRRFHKIKQILGSRKIIAIHELSRKMYRSEPQVRKDLKEMIKKNLFLQAHINQEFSCFLITNDLYEEYLNTVNLWNIQQEEWKKLGFEEEEQKLTEKIGLYLAKIENAVPNIHDKNLQQHLCQMMQAIQNLADASKQNPRNLANLHTFINYFLPLTDNLIDAYIKLPSETFDGENIQELRLQIPEALLQLLGAFEALSEKLCASIEIDISTDIYVMQAIMAQNKMTLSKEIVKAKSFSGGSEI